MPRGEFRHRSQIKGGHSRRISHSNHLFIIHDMYNLASIYEKYNAHVHNIPGASLRSEHCTANMDANPKHRWPHLKLEL